ncbi:MAG: hypothetical protein CSA42_07240 [Gammaproteobacteria bacterium]|nr:MAG: hypothetical protein CSA42_07240 [Gammaproteobacteria bacterium]
MMHYNTILNQLTAIFPRHDFEKLAAIHHKGQNKESVSRHDFEKLAAIHHKGQNKESVYIIWV